MAVLRDHSLILEDTVTFRVTSQTSDMFVSLFFCLPGD